MTAALGGALFQGESRLKDRSGTLVSAALLGLPTSPSPPAGYVFHYIAHMQPNTVNCHLPQPNVSKTHAGTAHKPNADLP